MKSAWILLAVVAFAALTALGARIAVPMVPVPMTLQSFVVLLAGAVLGARGGAASAGLYLIAAAAGLPVLSDGAGGTAAFVGPTAGYLLAFPIAALAVGVLGERTAWRRPLPALAVMAAGHLLILTLGAAWLATRIGVDAAIASGVAPFLIGAAVKSVLIVLCAPPLRRLLAPRLRASA